MRWAFHALPFMTGCEVSGEPSLYQITAACGGALGFSTVCLVGKKRKALAYKKREVERARAVIRLRIAA